MRIGLDVSKALPPRDGIGTYIAELLRAFIDLGGDDELFLYGLAEPLEVLRDQFHAQFGQAGPAAPSRCHLRPDGRPEDDGLDVFHCTTWTFPASFAGPTVFTCYDLTFLTHPQCHTLGNTIHCLTGMLEAQLAGAVFVAISQATADELRRRFGVSRSRLRVIYPAAAPVYAPLPAAQTRQRLHGLGIDGSYVLAVGTLEPRKNLRRLLVAWAGLPEELQQRYQLLVAGGEGSSRSCNLRRVRGEPCWRHESKGNRCAGASDRLHAPSCPQNEEIDHG